MTTRWEVVITAEAEVVTVADKFAALYALCDERQADAVDGGKTDVEAVWPSEIRKILDGVL